MNRHGSRRTTLTLPAGCLDLAERLASERKQNLSAVVGEALQRGLREAQQVYRSESIVKSYKEAFSDFSPEELLLLDGIVLSDTTPIKRPARKGRRPSR